MIHGLKSFTINLTLIILRGLPGSGKTTLANRIRESLRNVVILSADDFFLTRNGQYLFIKERLSEAHQSCQNKAKQACKERKRIIVIDNTNIQKSEIEPYLQLASCHKYIELILEPQTEWRINCLELARKSPHNVPLTTIQRRKDLFLPINPLFFGWFINEEDSNMILETARKYFKLCADRLVAFRVFLEKKLKHDGTFWNLYRREEVKTNILHCTSLSSVSRTRNEIEQYANSAEVTQAMGKASQLSIMGFYVTPRTIGARVQLSHQQQDIWKPPSGRSEGSPHVTLGYVKGVQPVQAGLDLLDIVKCEKLEQDNVRCTTFEAGVFRQFGEGRCCMYLNQPIVIDTLFTGKY